MGPHLLAVLLARRLVRRLVRVTRLMVGLPHQRVALHFRFHTHMARLRVSLFTPSGLRIR